MKLSMNQRERRAVVRRGQLCIRRAKETRGKSKENDHHNSLVSLIATFIRLDSLTFPLTYCPV